jgi:hypothetical protein
MGIVFLKPYFKVEDMITKLTTTPTRSCGCCISKGIKKDMVYKEYRAMTPRCFVRKNSKVFIFFSTVFIPTYYCNA